MEAKRKRARTLERDKCCQSEVTHPGPSAFGCASVNALRQAQIAQVAQPAQFPVSRFGVGSTGPPGARPWLMACQAWPRNTSVGAQICVSACYRSERLCCRIRFVSRSTCMGCQVASRQIQEAPC